HPARAERILCHQRDPLLERRITPNKATLGDTEQVRDGLEPLDPADDLPALDRSARFDLQAVVDHLAQHSRCKFSQPDPPAARTVGSKPGVRWRIKEIDRQLSGEIRPLVVQRFWPRCLHRMERVSRLRATWQVVDVQNSSFRTRCCCGMLPGMNPPACKRQHLTLLMLLVMAPSASAELFLSSFSGNRVLRYNETNGAFISVFVASGSGGLDAPHGLAFGPDGNFYVASANSDEVLRYNGTNGAFLNAFVPASGGWLDYPVWLEFRPDGFLYVSSQLNSSVVRFNATNGTFAGVFIPEGSGGLNGPSGMAWGTDGHLYVVGRFGITF